MKSFLTLIACFAIFSSCRMWQRIEGNGNVETKTYNLSNFDEIDVSSAVNVELTQGNFEVKLRIDQNLFDKFDLSVSGSTLKIRRRNGNIDPSVEPKVYVSMPVLKNIDVSGASSVEMTNQFQQTEKISFDVSGASNAKLNIRTQSCEGKATGASTVNIKGEVLNGDYRASGASSIQAFDCLTDKVNIDANGASTVKINAVSDISVDASGASTVKFKGKANISSQRVSGASSLSSVD